MRWNRVTPHARLLALMLVLVTLAGCFGSTQPTGGPAEHAGPAPGLSCPAPCARPIDTGARFEPAVAVHPTNPLHLVAASIDTTQHPVTREYGWWPLVHVSFDGGATWKTTRVPGGPSSDPNHPLFRYNAMGDPVPAFLPDGTLLLFAIADARASHPFVPYTATGDAVVLLRSTDGGLTFPEATVVKDGSGAYSPGVSRIALGRYGYPNVLMDQQDKEWFAIGPDGTVLLTWVRIQSDPRSPMGEVVSLVASASTDGGRTWSPLSTITTGPRLQGPFPVILDDGTWLVAYVDQSTSTAHTARSQDEGRTWEATPLDASTKFPVLAKGLGPFGERVFIAYPATSEGVDSPQTPTLRWSDDGGVTWSAPLPLDTPEAPGPTLPALAASTTGGAYVTFWHPTANGGELRAVAFEDGTLSAPLTLDTTEGDPGLTGHYMDVASLPDGGAFAVWNVRHDDQYTITGARLLAR